MLSAFTVILTPSVDVDGNTKRDLFLEDGVTTSKWEMALHLIRCSKQPTVIWSDPNTNALIVGP